VSRYDFDALVIGSGFGGSVTALRLTEKGYRVGVLEAGRRWAPEDFPTTNWDLRNFIWRPELGLRGMQKLDLLHDVLVLSIAGVGGGSLIYASTLYRPADAFYQDRHWRQITDWKRELDPYYDQAERMLGVSDCAFHTPADDVMQRVAERMGMEETYRPAPVGIWFGEPGVEVPDPYFGGEGPPRRGCIACGGCMVGCRYHAKNTLDRNYLWLAERNGAVIHPEHQVTGLRPLAGGGYQVVTARPGALLRPRIRTFTAEQVVLSAGVLGTLRLLFAMRDRGALPHLSPTLGELVRTNSESLLGVTARDADVDYSFGPAITSSVHPDEFTHLEPCRYPPGSNAMGMLATIAVEKHEGEPRWLSMLRQIGDEPARFARSLWKRGWSERSIILLVMQSLDNSIEVFPKLGPLGMRLGSRQGHGHPNPSYIELGYRAADHMEEVMGGEAGSSWNEAVLDIPMTAHIIGGATIGAGPDRGVVDPFQRVYGHPGLHIADGSVLTANLGANPSLTITSLAERAMAHWPNRGDEDPRPPLGEPYRPTAPVRPRRPAAPADAPAALRLPVSRPTS
jgi:cholesterol oxidase